MLIYQLSKTTPMTIYRQQQASGELHEDKGQLQALDALQRLHMGITEYQARMAAQARSFLSFLRKPPLPPKGLYIWGNVGVGKSMLMDMMLTRVEQNSEEDSGYSVVERLHFHAFMQRVHQMIHAYRQVRVGQRVDRKDALLKRVALDIAQDCYLLCLDEMQVTDVADAMLLDGLFSELIQLNVIVIFTSNRPPEELYKGGLQRERFMGFVEFIRKHLDVVELVSPHDYRLRQIKALKTTYFMPLGPSAQRFLAQAFDSLIHHGGAQSRELDINGRALKLKQAYGGTLYTSFAELCEQPLGAADYLAIAEHFHTVLLADIPELTGEKRNEAKRFVTLIDTLYDHKTKLICTAAAAPDRLYPEGDGSFEFQRTASRLTEMQSEKYLRSA